VIFLKSANIWQNYEQLGGCFEHFVRLAITLPKDEENARDNHVLACNFDKESSILNFNFFSLTD